jgi:acetylornithine deacetylase/succinyl-diaminopimelate desuccinylase-like protein
MTDARTDADDVIELCRDLIRIDTSNPGQSERPAAEYCAAKLDEVGIASEVFDVAPGRTATLARIPGADPSRPALLIHGHLDVVPADAADWSVHPFSGEVRDGCVWGRGAVDMKDMVAMTLATVRDLARRGEQPARDLVLAFVPDEEAGGKQGAHLLAQQHREWFESCTEAIGEVGGFSLTVAEGKRLYLIETAQKGMAWLRLVAEGRAGHGSMINDDNAVTALCEAVARIGRHQHAVHVTPTVRAFLEGISDALGVELDADDPELMVSKLGSLAKMVGATLRNTTNPTMLDAGYKVNVIPQRAEAAVDCRFLPGYEQELRDELAALVGPDIRIEPIVDDIALETTFDGDLVDAMTAALLAEDPDATAVPYMLSGGTDAKHFAPLGIRCFGFAPLRLPADLDFSGMFHGIDERVPTDALQFGQRVLHRFLQSC